jgi:hypothetical protein
MSGRRSVSAEAQDQPHTSVCGICGGQNVIESVFFPSILVSPVIVIPQKLYTHLSQALYSIGKWQR